MCKILALAFSSVFISTLHNSADAIRSPDEDGSLDASLLEVSEEMGTDLSGEIGKSASEESRLARTGETDIWKAFLDLITKKGTKQKLEANATGVKALDIWSKLLNDPGVSDKCNEVKLADKIQSLAQDPSQKENYLADAKLKALDQLMVQKLQELGLDFTVLEESTKKITGASSTSPRNSTGKGFKERPALKITVSGFPEDKAKNGAKGELGQNVRQINGVYEEDFSPNGEKCLNGFPTYWNKREDLFDEETRAPLPKTFMYYCSDVDAWLIERTERKEAGSKIDSFEKLKKGEPCRGLAFFRSGDIDQRNPYLAVSLVKIKNDAKTWATDGSADAKEACWDPKQMECAKADWVKNIGVSGLENMQQMQKFDCSAVKAKA